jgi:hypothetical protein
MSARAADVATPIVLVTAERSPKSGTWILTVARCPFCGRRHSHGGNDGKAPDLGYRLSHCWDRPTETYELQVAEAAEVSQWS